MLPRDQALIAAFADQHRHGDVTRHLPDVKNALKSTGSEPRRVLSIRLRWTEARSLCCLQPAIDAAFELAVEGDGAVVGEGQELAQKHTGDTFLRIEPVIGVEYSRPGDATGTPPIGPRERGDHVTEPPFARHVGEEIDIV